MDTQEQSGQRFFTVNEVAEMLRTSHDTVSRRIESGDLRAFRFGSRSTVISREDIEDYIAAHEVVK
jgi:excisionase family DNA binding protein